VDFTEEERNANKKIIFVCFANKSRSPMAKGLAQKMFPSKYHIDSAGTDSEASGGANFKAVNVMSEWGIDLTGHFAKSINDVAVSEFDFVVAMDNHVFDSVIRKYPDMEDRIILWQIDDPFYHPIGTYRNCAEEIVQNLKVLADRLGLSKLNG
jgi:protein-tyrosine phosphatase